MRAAWAVLCCSLSLVGCVTSHHEEEPPVALTTGLPIPDSLKSCPDGPSEPEPLPTVRTVDLLLSKLDEWQKAYRGMRAARNGCDRDRAAGVRWAGANTVVPGKVTVPLPIPEEQKP